MLKVLPVVFLAALCFANFGFMTFDTSLDPQKLSELAAAHVDKVAEIDELYTRWEAMQC